MQSPTRVIPAIVDVLPIGHPLQADCPDRSEYDPKSHNTHAFIPS